MYRRDRILDGYWTEIGRSKNQNKCRYNRINSKIIQCYKIDDTKW